jgi:hypothetical protein
MGNLPSAIVADRLFSYACHIKHGKLKKIEQTTPLSNINSMKRYMYCVTYSNNESIRVYETPKDIEKEAQRLLQCYNSYHNTNVHIFSIAEE